MSLCGEPEDCESSPSVSNSDADCTNFSSSNGIRSFKIENDLMSKSRAKYRRVEEGLLSDSEKERLNQRRERNKAAAARCRNRRRETICRLEKEACDWEGKVGELKSDIERLTKQRDQLEFLLQVHNATCSLINDPLPSQRLDDLISSSLSQHPKIPHQTQIPRAASVNAIIAHPPTNPNLQPSAVSSSANTSTTAATSSTLAATTSASLPPLSEVVQTESKFSLELPSSMHNTVQLLGSSHIPQNPLKVLILGNPTDQHSTPMSASLLPSSISADCGGSVSTATYAAAASAAVASYSKTFTLNLQPVNDQPQVMTTAMQGSSTNSSCTSDVPLSSSSSSMVDSNCAIKHEFQSMSSSLVLPTSSISSSSQQTTKPTKNFTLPLIVTPVTPPPSENILSNGNAETPLLTNLFFDTSNNKFTPSTPLFGVSISGGGGLVNNNFKYTNYASLTPIFTTSSFGSLGLTPVGCTSAATLFGGGVHTIAATTAAAGMVGGGSSINSNNFYLEPIFTPVLDVVKPEPVSPPLSTTTETNSTVTTDSFD